MCTILNANNKLGTKVLFIFICYMNCQNLSHVPKVSALHKTIFNQCGSQFNRIIYSSFFESWRTTLLEQPDLESSLIGPFSFCSHCIL